MKTLEEIWADYELRVIPKNAGPVQRNESRNAFYAGAVGVVSLLNAAPDSEPEAAAVVASLENELAVFHAELAARVPGAPRG